ncbi:hypothetical protein MJH12_13655, partial [bacterium]|nr:hypothetical protein [bacterium]
RFDHGIAHIGQNPLNQVDIYLFESSPELNRNGNIVSVDIRDFSDNLITFSNVKAMSCHMDKMALIDQNAIKIFTISIDENKSIQIVQDSYLDYYLEANVSKKLQGPKSLIMNDDFLFVVDADNKLIKYRLK